ncbi:putative lipoprotein [Liberibacter crescens BT-1]|uniref:Putative lipoprotein n=1 Tax=Liberibacter crescens (strain BT-1) TaxID=1215343 RepID=L0ESQ1_LIBCB|nr:putative lipoprotein [Liberibacter crescens BT-1]
MCACGYRKSSTNITNNQSLSTLENIAISAQKCWFKSKDPTFSAYRLEPELDSFSNKPRLLIVPKNNPEDLPLLVVQGEGSPLRLSIFGPLMSKNISYRISKDIQRWSTGKKEC